MAKGKRGSTEINASSMADIAFLLLIFFLVTTTIDQDKGILHGLPPWSDEPPPEDVILHERNVLEILVNSANQLLVEGQYMDVSDLKEITIKHISNNGRLPNFSDNPDKAIVSLKNDRGTSYDIYIQVQNELKAAYTELRDKTSDKLTKGSFVTYVELKKCADPLENKDKKEQLRCKAWKAEVKKAIPMKISEAEPTKIGE